MKDTQSSTHMHPLTITTERNHRKRMTSGRHGGTSNQIPERHVKILLRDFNALQGTDKKYIQITGSHTAHKRKNKIGNTSPITMKMLVFKFCQHNFKNPDENSPHGNHMWRDLQIDHVAKSNKITRKILNL